MRLRGNTLKYVSRGGLKLEKAMSHFDVVLENKICMDVGLPQEDLQLYAAKWRSESLCH